MKPIVTKKLEELQRSPFQSEYFRDLSSPEIAELASSMERDGLRQPIEICPNGEILDGHQRIAAARLLGWTSVECIVREELATDEDRERYMIDANLHRRRDDPLSLARCCRRLQELHRQDRRRQPKGRGKVRDIIAKKLQLGAGRNVDRLLKLLKLPRALQDAISEKMISQADG